MTHDLVAIGVLLLFSAFFSATEIAVTMSSRVRQRTRAERGVPGARLAERLLARPERAIITCLVGNNLVHVGAAALGREAVLAALPLGQTQAEVLAAVLLVPLVLLVGEVLPKAMAQTYPNRSLATLAGPLLVVRVVLAPLLLVCLGVAEVVRRVARFRSDLLDFLSREELKQFVAHSEKHGHVDREERELIYQIFEFWKIEPRRFLRPLADVPHLPAHAPAGEAKELMRQKRLARLVVTDASGQDVAGVVSATSLLEAPNDAPLAGYLQPPVRAQLAPGIDRLLSELQRSPSQIAVVRGPGDAPSGIIVLDDLLQHLLGRAGGGAPEAPAAPRERP